MQPKICNQKIMHNGKEKICKFFVAHNGSPAVLGMQDIDKLGLISINYNTKHRKVADEDHIDNSKSPSETEGGKHEQVKGEKQKEEAQSTQDADNALKPPIVINPMVMGISNNNNDSVTELITDTRDNGRIDFLAELLSSHSLVSDVESKDDTTIENTDRNTNEKKSFILDTLKDIGMGAPTTQKKMKRKQNKNKKNKLNKLKRQL